MRLSRWTTALRQHPVKAASAFIAVAAVAYTLVGPFLVTAYPPMTDFPFHASEMAIFRHYLDAEFHFREQFSLHPLEVPYVSMYVIGALLALVMPIGWAAKGMALAMLACVPLGMAVLFHGMKKSPTLGLVLGASVVWTKLTHWGWLSFVGALGLYGLTVGCALLALDKPSRMRSWLLFAALLSVFFTHVYRLPFAILAVGATALAVYPATRRVRPVVAPLAGVTALFVVWWWLRPNALAGEITIAFHPERLLDEPVLGQIFAGYRGAAGEDETTAARAIVYAALFALAVCTTSFFFERRYRSMDATDKRWMAGTTALALVLCAGHLASFVLLPMSIGDWWAVYPREIEAAAFFGLAAIPDLPRRSIPSLAVVVAVALATASMGYVVLAQWHLFDETLSGFVEVKKRIPRAPKLLYMVMDHGGTQKRDSPYMHLPAWIQAEKGGWLSFHFGGWNLYPARYRQADPRTVPPPFGHRWEWNPTRFLENKDWFDYFLVRSARRPDRYFRNDPGIQLIEHAGKFWLYGRAP